MQKTFRVRCTKAEKTLQLCRKYVHSCKMPNPFAVINLLLSDVYPHPLNIEVYTTYIILIHNTWEVGFVRVLQMETKEQQSAYWEIQQSARLHWANATCPKKCGQQLRLSGITWRESIRLTDYNIQLFNSSVVSFCVFRVNAVLYDACCLLSSVFSVDPCFGQSRRSVGALRFLEARHRIRIYSIIYLYMIVQYVNGVYKSIYWDVQRMDNELVRFAALPRYVAILCSAALTLAEGRESGHAKFRVAAGKI